MATGITPAFALCESPVMYTNWVPRAVPKEDPPFFELKVAVCNMDTMEIMITSQPELVFNTSTRTLELMVKGWTSKHTIVMFSYYERYRGLDCHLGEDPGRPPAKPLTLKRLTP